MFEILRKACLILLLYFLTWVRANQSSKLPTTLPKNSKGNDVNAADSASRLQSYWDLRDSLASKPNRAPLVMDKAGHFRVNVHVDLGVGGVIFVNDAQQTVTMSIMLHAWWNDPSLAWNPADYHGSHVIELSTDQLWMPQIYVVNSLRVFKIHDLLDSAEIDHRGKVVVQFPFNVKTLCSMDLSHFPYDTQRCKLSLSSYSKMVTWRIAPDYSANETEAFLLSTAWVTENVTSYLFSIHDEGVFPTVELKLRRKTAVFTVCLVLPMVLTSYMNTLVFLLPPDSGEKMSFLVTLFVSTSLFVSFFKEEMPRGLNTLPSIMKLLVFVLAESIIFLFVSILILRRHHLERECLAPHKEPALFQKHTIHPSNALCSKRNDGHETKKKNERSGQEHLANIPSAGLQAESNGEHKATTISAQRLDLVCFFLAFVANTLALIILLFSSL